MIFCYLRYRVELNRSLTILSAVLVGLWHLLRINGRN